MPSEHQGPALKLPLNHPSLRKGKLIYSDIETSATQRLYAARGDIRQWWKAMVSRRDVASEVFSTLYEEEICNTSLFCNYLPRGEAQSELIDHFVKSLETLIYLVYQPSGWSKWDMMLYNRLNGTTGSFKLMGLRGSNACPFTLGLVALMRCYFEDPDPMPPPGASILAYQKELSCALSLALVRPLILTVERSSVNVVMLSIRKTPFSSPEAQIAISARDFIPRDAHAKLLEIEALAREATELLNERDADGVGRAGQEIETLADELNEEYDFKFHMYPVGINWPQRLLTYVSELLKFYTTETIPTPSR